MSVTLIKNAELALQEGVRSGSVLISGDIILDILEPDAATPVVPDDIVDATGCLLFPGIIDDHVHFREPGLTHKACIATESRAAVAGGVTTVFDMPNCKPQTTSIAALEDKNSIAAENSLANYSFYLGATHDNISEIERIDPESTCGVKLFMGSSTGGMLVDDDSDISRVFKASPVIIAAHCEETGIINRNMEKYAAECGGEPPVEYHPLIRSAEACYASSARAIELADKTSARLHILHISTARELSLFRSGDVTEKRITSEVCPAHLFFSEEDYSRYGTRIKCNPAVKGIRERDALRLALASGLIDVVGTDHAPHLLSEKQGGCASAASGMPVLPYSLPVMLELYDNGVISISDIVRTMCHNPARLFDIADRGFIRKGYKADLALVRRNDSMQTVHDTDVPSRCSWSPFSGHRFGWLVSDTWVNGHHVFHEGNFNAQFKGQKIKFNR